MAKHGSVLEISIPKNSLTTVFSDRPYRIAKNVKGGVESFANFFAKSDFIKDPPNVTFAGTFLKDKQDRVSIIEIDHPYVKDGKVVLPIVQVIGSDKLPEVGKYGFTSFVVDNIWDWVEAVGTDIGTLGACTVGEVATLGAATAVCAGGIAASIGTTAGAIDGN